MVSSVIILLSNRTLMSLKRPVYAGSQIFFITQTLPKGSIIKSKMLILCGIPPHPFHLMLFFSYRFQKL
jgi:hypothetical protein